MAHVATMLMSMPCEDSRYCPPCPPSVLLVPSSVGPLEVGPWDHVLLGLRAAVFSDTGMKGTLGTLSIILCCGSPLPCSVVWNEQFTTV